MGNGARRPPYHYRQYCKFYCMLLFPRRQYDIQVHAYTTPSVRLQTRDASIGLIDANRAVTQMPRRSTRCGGALVCLHVNVSSRAAAKQSKN
ncbi:hypothetical protein TGAM01_v204810 [Trichoderma gamsii]|uniref:Uncharacterized protein n=1 Tax=Trichoderma gamsii TaxID=398673 RepID=A0A2P4ZPY1_9HYPO|nr:hypothetical protein TGAM01_v204810 [Trichoderma gamsii]PON26334.1 hypothetical protein TGAM01_v204810 [Trichoderma gamsii]